MASGYTISGTGGGVSVNNIEVTAGDNVSVEKTIGTSNTINYQVSANSTTVTAADKTIQVTATGTATAKNYAVSSALSSITLNGMRHNTDGAVDLGTILGDDMNRMSDGCAGTSGYCWTGWYRMFRWKLHAGNGGSADEMIGQFLAKVLVLGPNEHSAELVIALYQQLYANSLYVYKDVVRDGAPLVPCHSLYLVRSDYFTADDFYLAIDTTHSGASASTSSYVYVDLWVNFKLGKGSIRGLFSNLTVNGSEISTQNSIKTYKQGKISDGKYGTETYIPDNFWIGTGGSTTQNAGTYIDPANKIPVALQATLESNVWQATKNIKDVYSFAPHTPTDAEPWDYTADNVDGCRYLIKKCKATELSTLAENISTNTADITTLKTDVETLKNNQGGTNTTAAAATTVTAGTGITVDETTNADGGKNYQVNTTLETTEVTVGYGLEVTDTTETGKRIYNVSVLSTEFVKEMDYQTKISELETSITNLEQRLSTLENNSGSTNQE